MGKKEQGIHHGHRNRVREKIAANGMDSLLEHEFLEYVLFFSRPQGDTNPTAHRLLDKFGSLAKVFEADRESLLEVEGVGKNTVELMQLVPELCKRYLISKQVGSPPVVVVDDVLEHILPNFLGAKTEMFYVVVLDLSKNILKEKMLKFNSNIREVLVSNREIVSMALNCNGAFVVIAHNHLTDNVKPSFDDNFTTSQIKSVLEAVGIRLLDHIIVGANLNYRSYAEEGEL